MHLRAVREFAVELACEGINSDLRDVHGCRGRSDDESLAACRDSKLRKLKRPSPGEAASILCVADDGGSLHIIPEDRARVFYEHWRKVFGPSCSNEDLLKSWLSKRFPEREGGGWNTSLLQERHSTWTVTRRHIASAVA